MKPFDRDSLEEQTRLVPRYVAGDLSRSERADFEAWLIASPELAAEVEMERRLRRGMASAARRGWLRRPSAAGVERRRQWRMAAAASVVLAAGLALIVGLPRNTDDESGRFSGAQAQRAAPLAVRLGRVRGTGDSPDISFSRGRVPASLTVEPDVVVLTCPGGAVELECVGGSLPETPQYPEYELDLVARRGETLAWRSPRQEPAMRSELSFTLADPSVLKAGDYDVLVRGISPDHQEVVGRFWLQVTP